MTVAELENVEAWSGKDRGDENFPVGSALISARVRPHVHAFYAFARNADDIADSPTLTPEDKLRRLDVMEAVLRGEREDGSPSAARLREDLAETEMTPQHALELLVAFRQDATKRRYESWDELLDYCRHSAVPVGRHVLDLHGEGRQGWDASDALCVSLQVLNHLQDCARDLADLDRCYLPLDLLALHGATMEDLRRPEATPELRNVFHTLLDRCVALNRAALFLPRRTLDRRLRLETAVIVGLAGKLAARLRAGDPVAERIKLSKGDAMAAMFAALRYLA
jgi:farnesyl-diphosphate farnesyltransferase